MAVLLWSGGGGILAGVLKPCCGYPQLESWTGWIELPGWVLPYLRAGGVAALYATGESNVVVLLWSGGSGDPCWRPEIMLWIPYVGILGMMDGMPGWILPCLRAGGVSCIICCRICSNISQRWW